MTLGELIEIAGRQAGAGKPESSRSACRTPPSWHSSDLVFAEDAASAAEALASEAGAVVLNARCARNASPPLRTSI